MVVIQVVCVDCGKPHGLRVKAEEALAWDKQGGKRGPDAIQAVMPSMSPDDREMLISGMCPTCWDELFGQGE